MSVRRVREDWDSTKASFERGLSQQSDGTYVDQNIRRLPVEAQRQWEIEGTLLGNESVMVVRKDSSSSWEKLGRR